MTEQHVGLHLECLVENKFEISSNQSLCLKSLSVQTGNLHSLRTVLFNDLSGLEEPGWRLARTLCIWEHLAPPVAKKVRCSPFIHLGEMFWQLRNFLTIESGLKRRLERMSCTDPGQVIKFLFDCMVLTSIFRLGYKNLKGVSIFNQNDTEFWTCDIFPPQTAIRIGFWC